MSEEVKNEENNSKQKWLWLLLLLLLIVFVVIAIVVFLKDNGTAEATDNISQETSQEQVKNNDEPDEKTGISSNEKTQKLVVTASENLLAAAITPAETTTSITEKIPVVVNVSDNSYFNEAVVLEITGEDFTATITDSNGNVSNYEGKATLSEDGKYTLTIKDSDGTEKTVSFTIDTTNPSITGVEDGKLYNTEVTPIIEELNIDKIVLTKDGSETEYNSGDAITEDGEYILEVIDKAGNSAAISFVIDVTVPKLALNGDAKIKIEAGIDTYTELGATVTDNYDETIANLQPKFINYSINGVYQGKVSSVDNKKLGTYKIVYECTDKAGNIGLDASRDDHAYVMRVVEVVDTTKPVITLNGESVINHLEKGVDTYTEVGAISTDNYDTTQTIDKPSYINLYVLNSEGQYAFSGRVPSVDTKVVGRYNLVYTDVDSNGNEAVKVTRMVFVKDTIAPTATIEYSTTEVTNKDVVATLKADENVMISDAETWTPASEFGTIFNKSYDKNTTQIITITDESGNTNTVEVKIQNIDKTAPTAISIEYSTEQLTNGNVVVTITASEPLYSHPGWKKGNRAYKITKTFTQNTEETVILKDKAGNEMPVTIKITNIDKDAPIASISTSNNNGNWSTNQDVIATLIVNEPIKDITGWTKVDEKTFTKVYSENKKEKFEIEDLAGNITKVEFEVKRIDKVPPSITVIDPNNYKMEVNTEYIEKGYTAYDVVDKDVTNLVTKKYQFQAKGTGTWSFVDELDTSKLGTYKIIYIAKDKAGNESTGTRTVTIVDTTAPVITLNGESVINHLEKGVDSYTELGAISTDNYDTAQSIDKPSYINLYVLNSEGQYAFSGRVTKVDTNVIGRYNLVYTDTDTNGNEAIKVTRMVFVKDTIAPTPSKIEYSTKQLTNGNVKVTITATEPLYSHPGWSKGKAYVISKTFTENTEETVILKDKVGNKNPITISVTNIDKVAPVVTVESVVERVEDADGNWIDVKGGQRLIANEDVEIVNEPALVPVNGSAREYEIVYSLFNPTHTGYHFINVTVRDRAGNETTTDVEIFIPEYPTSNLNSTSLRMTKAAPKTAAVQTNTTPVVIGQEGNNDKSDDPIQDDLLQNDLLTTDEKKDDTNVIPTDPIVDDKKDNQVTMETDIIPEDKKETIPTQPVVDNVQNNIPTEPVIETPVVEEPKAETTPAPVEEVVEEPVITESEILDPVVAE